MTKELSLVKPPIVGGAFSARMEARAFLAALKLALGTCKRSPTPVLERLLVEARAGQVTLCSTDLANTTRVAVDVSEASGSGAATLHRGGLLAFAKNAARLRATLTLSCSGGKVTLSFGSRRLRSDAEGSDEYPAVPSRFSSAPVLIDRKGLLELLTDVNRFSARDDSRPHMSSVLLRVSNGELFGVATDGHRLAKITHPVLQDGPKIDALVPRRSIALWATMLRGSKAESAALRTRERDIELRVDRFSLTARSVDARFPPFEQVIPTVWEREIVLPRDAMIDAAKLAVSMGRFCRRLKIESEGKGTIEVSSRSQDGVEIEDSFLHDGDPFRIGVDGEGLLDALVLGREAHVGLRISGPLDPILLVNERAVVVVMPTKI